MSTPSGFLTRQQLRQAARARAIEVRDAELDAAWAAVWGWCRRVFSAGRRARPAGPRSA